MGVMLFTYCHTHVTKDSAVMYHGRKWHGKWNKGPSIVTLMGAKAETNTTETALATNLVYQHNYIKLPNNQQTTNNNSKEHIVCMHACMRVCMWGVHTRECMCAWVHECMHACMCVWVCACVCMPACMGECLHVWVHLSGLSSVYICSWPCAHDHVC